MRCQSGTNHSILGADVVNVRTFITTREASGVVIVSAASVCMFVCLSVCMFFCLPVYM